LHGIAESHQRATLLSVKGLAFNLGYGAYSLIFSLMLAGIHQGGTSSTPPFQQVLLWQAAGFAVVLLIFIAATRRVR
jgi:predicted cobalt transporter CbtA